jgi:hypothetical protein
MQETLQNFMTVSLCQDSDMYLVKTVKLFKTIQNKQQAGKYYQKVLTKISFCHKFIFLFVKKKYKKSEKCVQNFYS